MTRSLKEIVTQRFGGVPKRTRGISIDISKEVHRSDGFTLSTVHKGQYVKFRYIEYSDREARKLFRQYVKEQTK